MSGAVIVNMPIGVNFVGTWHRLADTHCKVARRSPDLWPAPASICTALPVDQDGTAHRRL